ncbi:MAG: hypothetical protein U0640_12535, partial [Phycisphaerales bacterium]
MRDPITGFLPRALHALSEYGQYLSQVFDHWLFHSQDFRLWSLPVAALLGAFALLIAQRARPRTGCPLKALRGIGFQLELNPSGQVVEHAWSMAGAWQSVQPEQDHMIATGKMSLARRTVHA